MRSNYASYYIMPLHSTYIGCNLRSCVNILDSLFFSASGCLETHFTPDILIGEPVGSSTDLRKLSC